MYTLEQAKPEELDICADIIRGGREFQNEQGFTQWTEEYPNRETIREDIQKGTGYVIKAEGTIAGYLFLDFSGEPAYNDIWGEWRTEEPYAVVHRIAFHQDFRGKGLSDEAFRLVEEICAEKGVHGIRMDTHFPNNRMQHVLTKNGFVQCGVIWYEDDERLAYDKIL